MRSDAKSLKIKNYNSDIKKYVDKIAGKLLAEGLVASRYTKKEAKMLTKGVVSQKFVHKMIDGFSPEIKKSMLEMRKKK